LAPKTTTQLESDTEIEKDKRKNKGKLNTRPIGPPDTSHSFMVKSTRKKLKF